VNYLLILAFLFETDFEDDIVGGIVRYESNYTSTSIKIGWNEPEDPNGLVIKYLLEYRRSDNASLIIFL
jgi:insulin receptor